jgi:hypothetical protein
MELSTNSSRPHPQPPDNRDRHSPEGKGSLPHKPLQRQVRWHPPPSGGVRGGGKIVAILPRFDEWQLNSYKNQD